MREITEKDLLRTVQYWDERCSDIMESQRKFNSEALKWSEERFETWIQELRREK